jgi:uncharacterized protein YvpB
VCYKKSVEVPLFKQLDKKTCGPIALQMALATFGHQVDHNDILRYVGGVKANGVNTVDLANFARQQGFQVECLSYNKKLSQGGAEIRTPSFKDVRRHLDRGVPVILAVNSPILYGGKIGYEGHFIVLTGYENGVFKYNDPFDGAEHEVDEEHLLFAWHNNVLDSSAYLLAVWPKNHPTGVSV